MPQMSFKGVGVECKDVHFSKENCMSLGREPQAAVSKEVLENTCKKQLEEVTLERIQDRLQRTLLDLSRNLGFMSQ